MFSHELSDKWLLTAIVLSTAFIVASLTAYVSIDLPEIEGKPIRLTPMDFKFMMGSGKEIDDQLLVDGYSDDFALISSGAISVNAANNHILHIDWDPMENRNIPVFFWRTKADARNIHRMEFWKPGNNLFDLSKKPEWRGDITEIGLLISNDHDAAVAIGPVRLEPESIASRLYFVWQAWTAFEPWTMKSVNFLEGGKADQAVPLTVILIAWLAVALLILWLSARLAGKHNSSQLLKNSLTLVFIAWILLDARWISNNIREIRQTLWTMDEQQLQLNDADGPLFEAIQRLKKEVLDQQPSRILLIGDELGVAFYYLARAKYHLAPHSAHVARHLGRALAPETVDYYIYIGPTGNMTRIPGWDSRFEQNLELIEKMDLIDNSEEIAVYRSKKNAG